MSILGATNIESSVYIVDSQVLNSFDDIFAASKNNYGITLSLFWYLVETYGYEEIYDYIRYVGETFEQQPTITQQQKEQTAMKFLGKTEEQVLTEWLMYFDYFDGELAEFKETTTATVNYVLFENDVLLPSFVGDWLKTSAPEGINFIMNIEEWIEDQNYTQAHSFKQYATGEFELVAKGHEKVNVRFTGANFSDWNLTNGQRLHGYAFNIPTSEVAKLVPGVAYEIVPINNDAKYKWIIPASITLTYSK